MLISQVVQGVLLPFVLIFMLLLINNKRLMGDYVNSRFYNIVSWSTVAVMILLTLAMVAATLWHPAA
jgi:Mn2+/Fe2+ NRAMP family transporter